MNKALFDTNIVSAFMRDIPQVVEKIKKYLQHHETLSISVITYYELLRGLKAIDNRRKLHLFQEFMSLCLIINIDSDIAENASDIYDVLRRKGQLVEDADILIAATALVHELIVITDNTAHFERISRLKFENWIR
jgi:tRNA(fMet)-specific endonuclease VapC